MLGGGLAGYLVEYCRSQLGGQAWLNIDRDFIVGHWNGTLGALGQRLLPILGLICVAGVAASVLQIGFLFVPKKVAPDLSRLDPVGGLRRIFAGSNMVHLGFGVFKVVIVLAVGGAVLYGERESLLGLSTMGPAALARQMTHILLATMLKIGAALLILAILDYVYQRWRYEQDLKMTPQELREELRNLEGDPQLAAKRKQTRRELATRRSSASEKIDAPTQADRLMQ